MRWWLRRDLFRLWVVISSIWVVMTGGTWIWAFMDPHTSAFDLLWIGGIVIFVPPLALLLAGLLVVWALSGFGRK